MGDVQSDTLHADTIDAFRGMIYMLRNGREIPLRLSRSSDKFSWGIAPQDDWLQAGGAEPPPVFDFVFHSQGENRLHFNICGTGLNGAKKLGISRNGYLGLYAHAEVNHYWKLEPLEWTANGLVCHWRDHQGHQVKAMLDTPHYTPGNVYLLNVEEGEPHAFLVKRID
ncbi:hypothetical protein N5D52_25885 [Pseudomonas sp. GD03860]|uniref:hypothetical protein n=1 Tax=Pseudomonas TaxID=286 RepID=UPI002363FB72|nr:MULTISPECIES: hypothetical protein [Pseudomonas]MDD2057239.1 hypothetical protein [Pseudomonas putida]MDH0640360.1 hypothetical protein [Pseudomonas sp. GD03860]